MKTESLCIGVDQLGQEIYADVPVSNWAEEILSDEDIELLNSSDFNKFLGTYE